MQDEQDEKMLLSLSQDSLTKHNLFANYCFLVSLCQQRRVVQFSKNQQLMSFLAYSNLMCRMKSRKWSKFSSLMSLEVFEHQNILIELWEIPIFVEKFWFYKFFLVCWEYEFLEISWFSDLLFYVIFKKFSFLYR